jgi:cell volume regulation protein A
VTEIADFGTVVLFVAIGLVLGVLSTRLTDRVPIPAPAIFLVAAALASDAWPGIYEHVPIETVERVAVVALIVILLNGGMDIGWRRFRVSAAPILLLGVLGTFVTAGAVALCAHFLLGFEWLLAGLVGAAVAPTDPAVMFSVLGGREVEGRSGTTLEGEAGVNDPAGIALMLGMIELATHDGASFWVVVKEFAIEMAVGAASGLAGVALLIPLVRRLRLSTMALYPIFILSAAAALYGATSVAHGSGFLAVFIAGLFLAEIQLPALTAIKEFHTTLASLAELAVFVSLGLTINLSDIPAAVWGEGLVIAIVVALMARPLAVVTTISAAQFTRGELLFITWSGLKGAVPILLAAFALIGDAPGAGHVYQVVFVVVLVSVVGQGTLVPLVARQLGVPMSLRAPAERLLERAEAC